MSRDSYSDLNAFLAVAREESFTKAAAQLGVSPSALSQTIRALEERLGIRLLTRTTRSVSTTTAGERLQRSLTPHFESIQDELEALSELRDKPAGTIRITAGEHAVSTVLWPAVRPLLLDYPDIHVELIIEQGLTDIVAERYDAGVRMGEQVDKDMIAVPIGPPMRFTVVGSPDYFKDHKPPKLPQDLTEHRCINMRLPTRGGLYAWEFEKGKRDINVHVDGPLALNSVTMRVEAALAGLGLAYLPEDQVLSHVLAGRLVGVLDDWLPPSPGYHLYYPSRRQPSPAFRLLVDALRR